MAFGLSQILFTTITRLTLVFNETVDPTSSINTDPANYVIAGGDVVVLGNFSISGSSVSFDIALAVPGAVYDITLNNLLSSQGQILPTTRTSFFFGIGSITPFLVGTITNLGSLYLISDSALVGPIAATSNPTFALGTSPGQSVVESYNELLSEIPDAPQAYLVGQVTIPYQSGPANFLYIGAPNVLVGLFINNVFVGEATTNFQGWVGISVVLPPGEVNIRLSLSTTTAPFNLALVNSKFTTWLGGITDTLGAIDQGIQQVKDSRSIERVTSDDIEANFGQFVKTTRVSSYSLEVYRALLVEVIQAFRYFSATPEGLTNVMAAFTQVRPLLKWFRRDAPRWILGWQHLINRELTIRPRFGLSTFPSTNILVASVSSSNETGSADVLYNPGTSTLQFKSVGDGSYGSAVTIIGPGQYTLTSGNDTDTIVVSVGSPLPVVTVTIPITITGLPDPTGVTTNDVTYRITNGALMHRNGLVLDFTVTGSAPSVTATADPTTFEHLGELFVGSFWVKQSTGSSRTMVVEFSDDNGGTWATGTPKVIPSGTYTRVDYTASLGFFGSPGILVRLRGTNYAVNDTFLVEKACLHSPQTGALYLGKNTRPRSRRRKYFGYQLLQFLREPLEIQAFINLGLQPALGWGLDAWSTSPYGSPSFGYLGPVPESPGATNDIGLLQYIVPTHVELDTFQDSVLSSGSGGVVNVCGVVYEADWRAGTAQNLTVVPLVPDRFTYVQPTTPTQATEIIVFDGGGLAELGQVSLQNMAQSRLLQDGVPIPNTDWEYASSTSIQLTDLGDLNPNSVYTFSYTVVISFQSAVIDCGPDFALFNWYADWYEYNRMRLDPVDEMQSQSLQFSPNTLLAVLSERADLSISGAVLSQSNGTLTTPVSTNSWSFIDAGTVKINADVFDPTVSYSLTYIASSLVKTSVVTSVVQVQHSTDGVTFSDPITIPHDAPFGNKYRYWQFSISVFNVGDIRDYKLRSMTMKGDPLDRTTIQSMV